MLGIAASALLGLAFASTEPRELQTAQPMIAGYAPGSDVKQHNRIDLDQQEMEKYLKEATPNWAKATAIYTTGAHSGAKATITVPVATTAALTKGDSVTQASNAAATGYIKSTKAAGVTSFDVTYSDASSLTCVDNAHAEDAAVTSCYKAGVGAVTVHWLAAGIIQGSVAVGIPSSVANSYRTLQGFSTKAGSKMSAQPNFIKFKAYYTHADYANRYVLEALQGNGAFTGKDNKAREQGVKKGTAYMNVWMYTIHEMEDAIADCKAGCLNCNDDPVHAWDEAVAFYTGTLEGVDGSGSGKLLYNLADYRCANFMTCVGAGGTMATSGTSQVNTEIFKLFKQGLTKLTNGECSAVTPIKNSIVSLMTVPLVQGSLRYAYKVALLNGGSKEQAEGAVFSAAVLPLVHACSSTAATTISNNMKINAATPMVDGFPAVKTAFESTYSCLGITCAHVGGLILTGTTYYPETKPCKDPTPTSSDSKGNSMFFAVTVISYIIMFATQ